MWLVRNRVSGRASDLESQPMSGVEEEERQNELYTTETFPVAGTAAAAPFSPPEIRQPLPNPNLDEDMREEVRKRLLKRQQPFLNMMKQIAGAANCEYHRIVTQEVTEEAVDFVFNKEKKAMLNAQLEIKAKQWLKDARKANLIYNYAKNVVDQFEIGVYLRFLDTATDPKVILLIVGIPNEICKAFRLDLNQSFLNVACVVYDILVKYDVFLANTAPNPDSEISMQQAVELSKFNLGGLREIVEANESKTTLDVDKLYKYDVSDNGDLFPTTASRGTQTDSEILPLQQVVRQVDSDDEMSVISTRNSTDAGVDMLLKDYVSDFLRAGTDKVTEIESRMEGHVNEACQIVYDVLTSRGGEDEMVEGAHTVRNYMFELNEGIDGVKILFARLVANRMSLSNDLAPKQHYLQARFARLRQQAALLMVNLRRLHYKNGKFTLDTAIPRPTRSIY